MILALVLVLSPLSLINADAVEYPAGVTPSQAQSVIPKLNKLVKTLLASGGEKTDLKGMLYDTLYSDETLNTLFAEIYTTLGETDDTLSLIGINISPAALANALAAYPSISKKIASCSSLAAVISASKNFKWEVNSKNDFGKALSAMLSPFNNLLNALLCSGKVQINSLIAIQGDDGYSSVIVPLLKTLDCPEIMTSEAFAASAAKNYNNIIKNIVSMALAAVDKLIEDPVIGLCETLPKVAHYLNSGKLSAAITTLLQPLTLKVAGIFTIPGLSDAISSIVNIEESVNLDEMIEGIDLTELLGEGMSLQMPEIDLNDLASCVTESNGNYTVDTGASFIIVMDYLVEALKLNKDTIGTATGTDLSTILDPLLSKTNDEIIRTFISLFSITSAPANNYQWVYPAINTTLISYTPTFGAEDYLGFIDKVDPLLTDFVKETDPEGSIEDTLRKTIYSGKTVSALVTGIFSAIGSEEMAPLFSLLGINVTPAGVANTISGTYSSAASTLYRYSSWDKVNPDALYWGFADGNREGFIKAITKVLSPFAPLLSCVLAGKNMMLLDAITIPGADGYNTAIIPLLEALGCEASTIKTYEQYKTGAGTNAVITDILETVTALIDRVCASPAKTAFSILPNVVYFFNSGLLTSVIENLIYPVKYMLDTAGMGDMLTSALSEMTSIDLNSLVTDLTKDMDLGIALPAIDLNLFGTLGTATTLTSKRTVAGAPAQYTYITADTPAVFVSVMRLLVSAISMEENSNLLTDLMGSADMGGGSTEGMPDMFAMYAGNITEKFKNMTNDEIVEWLCDLLFSDSPVAEIPDANEEIPTIIYEEKFELSTTAKLLIVVGLIAAAALVYYYLSVSGKLDNVKLKRRKKQEAKRREEESKKLIKAGGVAVDALGDMPEKKKRISKKASKSNNPSEDTQAENEVKKPEATADTITTDEGNTINVTVVDTSAIEKKTPKSDYAGEILKAKAEKEEHKKSEKDIARQEKADNKNEKKAAKLSRSKLPDEKATEKLLRRQQAAARKAIKNEKKAQMQYEKAIRQAEKKNKK